MFASQPDGVCIGPSMINLRLFDCIFNALLTINFRTHQQKLFLLGCKWYITVSICLVMAKVFCVCFGPEKYQFKKWVLSFSAVM